MGETFHLAANNGDIGGGEIMLLHAARALRALGQQVNVVAPDAHQGVADEAAKDGFRVTRLPERRGPYVRALRAWDRRHRSGWLWCHGLVPATATAGHPARVVHLHQAPSGRPQQAAAMLARWRARMVLVPSHEMATRVPGATVMTNWTEDVEVSRPATEPRTGPVRIGFIGRHSVDKGLTALAGALAILDDRHPGRFELVLAGEPRFVDADQQRQVEEALAPVDHLVRRLGWVPREELFSAVHLAAFPSVWNEPFGLVVAEAMAAKVPFVISDAGALPEVAGGSYPWVSRAGDPGSLAASVEELLRVSPSQLDNQLQTQRERWETHFSPEAGQARVADLLARLDLEGRPS